MQRTQVNPACADGLQSIRTSTKQRAVASAFSCNTHNTLKCALFMCTRLQHTQARESGLLARNSRKCILMQHTEMHPFQVPSSYNTRRRKKAGCRHATHASAFSCNTLTCIPFKCLPLAMHAGEGERAVGMQRIKVHSHARHMSASY